MKKSSIGQKAILLGNGINYLSADSIGWGDILENLKNSPEINQINTEIQKVDLKNPLKPFPLAYEEILNLLSQDTTIDIDRLLKQSIVSNISNQLIKKKGFNKYHTDILNTKIKHILTTNYDYGLELSKIENFQNEKKEYSINNFEIKKNNHRGYILPSDQYIWHIHGELSDNRSHTKSPNEYAEQSILIGNEYYGISIKNIEQYISGKEKSKHAKSLVKRISNNDPVSSWIDLFFTHDIYFIGLGLDFVEQDIWWLLNYRANVKKRFLAKGIEINNNLTYLYADIEKTKIDLIREIKIGTQESAEIRITEWLKDQIDYKKDKAKAEIMNALGVINKPISCISYKEFFDKVISDYLN